MKNVCDAKRKLVFEITADDVTQAKRHDKRNCVIACAMKTMPGITSVEVGADIVRVNTPEGRTRYRTPDKLRAALMEFDKTGHWNLPAGVYALTPPPPSLSQEGMRKAHLRRQDSGTRHKNKAGKRYGVTGRYRKRQVNPRVLEFARLKAATAYA